MRRFPETFGLEGLQNHIVQVHSTGLTSHRKSQTPSDPGMCIFQLLEPVQLADSISQPGGGEIVRMCLADSCNDSMTAGLKPETRKG